VRRTPARWPMGLLQPVGLEPTTTVVPSHGAVPSGSHRLRAAAGVNSCASARRLSCTRPFHDGRRGPGGSHRRPQPRPGQTSGRVGFGSGQGRVTGRIGRPAPDPYLSPGRVGLARAPCAGVSGRVFFGLGRVFWPLGRVFRVGSGFGSKITARARPVDCCGSKNTARAHPPRSSGRVGSGFFRAGWVGLFGSGDPCPGLLFSN